MTQKVPALGFVSFASAGAACGATSVAASRVVSRPARPWHGEGEAAAAGTKQLELLLL